MPMALQLGSAGSSGGGAGYRGGGVGMGLGMSLGLNLEQGGFLGQDNSIWTFAKSLITPANATTSSPDVNTKKACCSST
ncbi:hypothetical protein EV1_033498 [Malus domestica]